MSGISIFQIPKFVEKRDYMGKEKSKTVIVSRLKKNFLYILVETLL